nr:hypothetical protein [Tanacetum cinerariifolium]
MYPLTRVVLLIENTRTQVKRFLMLLFGIMRDEAKVALALELTYELFKCWEVMRRCRPYLHVQARQCSTTYASNRKRDRMPCWNRDQYVSLNCVIRPTKDESIVALSVDELIEKVDGFAGVFLVRVRYLQLILMMDKPEFRVKMGSW